MKKNRRTARKQGIGVGYNQLDDGTLKARCQHVWPATTDSDVNILVSPANHVIANHAATGWFAKRANQNGGSQWRHWGGPPRVHHPGE